MFTSPTPPSLSFSLSPLDHEPDHHATTSLNQAAAKPPSTAQLPNSDQPLTSTTSTEPDAVLLSTHLKQQPSSVQPLAPIPTPPHLVVDAAGDNPPTAHNSFEVLPHDHLKPTPCMLYSLSAPPSATRPSPDLLPPPTPRPSCAPTRSTTPSALHAASTSPPPSTPISSSPTPSVRPLRWSLHPSSSPVVARSHRPPRLQRR